MTVNVGKTHSQIMKASWCLLDGGMRAGGFTVVWSCVPFGVMSDRVIACS
jgi:hypothetical protein